MDLADIRKKAQLEKSAAKEALPPVNSQPLTETDNNDNDLPVPWEAESENIVSVNSEVPSLLQEHEKRPTPFDPLAILLAGRQNTGCSTDSISELPADESLDRHPLPLRPGSAAATAGGANRVRTGAGSPAR